MSNVLSPAARVPVLGHLARYGDRPCFYFEGATITYDEVLASIYRIARAFLECGLRPGDGIAVLADNRPEVYYVRIAAQLTGIRTTALHALGGTHEHAYIVEDAELQGIVFDPRYSGVVDKLSVEVDLRIVASLGPAECGFDVLALAASQPAEAPSLGPIETPRALVYTGGTTGRPKGIIMSPAAQAFATETMAKYWQWPEDIRLLLSTPLNHAAGTLLPTTFARGGCVILMPSFQPENWLRAVQDHRVSTALLVPTQLYRILDSPAIQHTDLSSVQTIFYGASPCSPTRLAQAIDIFGPVFFQFYGQTEAPMTVSVLRREEHDVTIPGRLTSCGRPVPGIEVGLLDDDGELVAKGEPGEICVRGPLVALEEYKNRPAETATALAGGWLHTGDVATQDPDGFLHIVDRKKDMIVSGGLNVFPREIEDCLSAHPAVKDVAVIGVPDDRWGEAVKAVVVLRPSTEQAVTGQRGAQGPNPAEPPEQLLIQYVRSALGPLHAPKSVDFVDAIPLGPLGKPDKKALRAQHWGDRDRLVN